MILTVMMYQASILTVSLFAGSEDPDARVMEDDCYRVHVHYANIIIIHVQY